MTRNATQNARLGRQASEAMGWLTGEALPLWGSRGRDGAFGFAEALPLDGQATNLRKRVRVQARQVYCFALAQQLDLYPGAHEALEHGLKFLLGPGMREDGLVHHLVQRNGDVIFSGPVLYDQAFLALALAHSFAVTGEAKLRHRAIALMRSLKDRFSHPTRGFFSTSERRTPLESNPHMHLFEAALAWAEIDDSPIWFELADEMVSLCSDVFVEPRTGALCEEFNLDWSRSTSRRALVEPGHCYEWAWLLLRYQGLTGESVLEQARALYRIAEKNGVCAERDVAVNALTASLDWADGKARLWPQTERLKASLALAMADRDDAQEAYVFSAQRAYGAIKRYLDGVPAGLWHDELKVDGAFCDTMAPASSFYHLIGAFAELHRTSASLSVQH